MAPHDDHLPAVRILLGGGARDLVGAAVGAHGGRVLHLSRRQAVYKPRRSLIVRYSADVSWAGRPATRETIVAVADTDGPLPNTLVLEADDLRVSLFRYPADPALPGLALATSPQEVAALLGWTMPPRLEAKTYRPCARAVIRAASGEMGERYLKVKRPSEVRALAGRLRTLADTAPVPPVLDVRPEVGIIVLGALPGVNLREVLRNGDIRPPDPETVLASLAPLSDVPLAGSSPRRSPAERAGGFAEVLAAVLPASRRRLELFVARLGDHVAPPSQLVHGDFHPAQVMVDGGRVSGLLDVDDVGLGRPVDDLATFLGHLANLTLDDRSGSIRAYLARALVAFEAIADRDELHRQTAAVILGLATGPHRVQHAHWRYTTLNRIGLAERWLAGDVRSLRRAS